jgi:hypothetical protein
MNDVMRGKIEACLELSEGREYKFKKDVMKVTGLTDGGFHLLNVNDVDIRYAQTWREVRDCVDHSLVMTYGVLRRQVK